MCGDLKPVRQPKIFTDISLYRYRDSVFYLPKNIPILQYSRILDENQPLFEFFWRLIQEISDWWKMSLKNKHVCSELSPWREGGQMNCPHLFYLIMVARFYYIRKISVIIGIPIFFSIITEKIPIFQNAISHRLKYFHESFHEYFHKYIHKCIQHVVHII